MDALRQLSVGGWNDFELTASRLAGKLRLFGVRSRRNSAGSARGYHEDDFADAFARYNAGAGDGGRGSVGSGR